MVESSLLSNPVEEDPSPAFPEPLTADLKDTEQIGGLVPPQNRDFTITESEQVHMESQEAVQPIDTNRHRDHKEAKFVGQISHSSDNEVI